MPHRPNNVPWTDEMKATLLDALAKGETTSQIQKRIQDEHNRIVTRNAVLGVAFRMRAKGIQLPVSEQRRERIEKAVQRVIHHRHGVAEAAASCNVTRKEVLEGIERIRNSLPITKVA